MMFLIFWWVYRNVYVCMTILWQSGWGWIVINHFVFTGWLMTVHAHKQICSLVSYPINNLIIIGSCINLLLFKILYCIVYKSGIYPSLLCLRWEQNPFPVWFNTLKTGWFTWRPDWIWGLQMCCNSFEHLTLWGGFVITESVPTFRVSDEFATNTIA